MTGIDLRFIDLETVYNPQAKLWEAIQQNRADMGYIRIAHGKWWGSKTRIKTVW